MKWLIGICTVMAMMFATTANAQLMLDFDDITTDVSDAVIIPDGYGGLDWDAFGVIHKDVWGSDGYENGTVSGNYVAYNRFAAVATVDDGLFMFDGAYLTAAWNEDLNIDIDGYVDGSLVQSTTVVVDPYAPTWFDFGWVVDELVFASYGGTNAGLDGSGTHFAMDNFTYSIEIDVDIDIKGGSCPNPLNPKSKGNIPVAILASDGFDPATVDPTTITLNGVPAVEDQWTFEDSTAPGDYTDACDDCFDADDPANFNCDTDLDGVDDAFCGDGTDELVVYFDTQALVDSLGTVEKGACVVLELTGQTVDGVDIIGYDSMVVLKAIN
jgi:hypothetical protein